MPTLRSRNGYPETAAVDVANLSQCAAEQDDSCEIVGAEMEGEESGVSEYEQTREKRIKENMERMKKLGIFDMSLQLKSAVLFSKPARKRKALDFKNMPVQEVDVLPRPTRRSSRLQNATPVSYAEVAVERKGNSRSRDIYLEVGSKPEVYNEKHDMLLGECNMSWTLFVDGYGKDGKRIYDPVKGKTCHQCRQKTLGHRTACSKCNLVQGQFCGDCLYMRYGEHVLEANQNPDWICPPCRGICNCSLCRQAKGWAPTGPLFRKIASLGYKSVAHFLFQTRRTQTDDDDNDNDPHTKTPSRRQLPFADGAPSVNDVLGKVIAQQSETHNVRKQSDDMEKKDDDMHAEDGHIAEQSVVDPNNGDNENAHKTMVEMNALDDDFATDHSALEVTDDNNEKTTNMHAGENSLGTERKIKDMGVEIAENAHKSGLETLQEIDRAIKNPKADVGNNVIENEHLAIKGMLAQGSLDYINTPDKTSTRKRQSVIVEPSPYSIAGRLKLRRKGLCNFKSTY